MEKQKAQFAVSYLLALELPDSHLFLVSLASERELWPEERKENVARGTLDGAHATVSDHTSDSAAPCVAL